MKKQIKVAYFPSDTPKDKVLGSNGKSLDVYCIKGVPDEDLSTGNYIIDLTFRIDDNIQDLLQEEVILKVLMDYGNEVFRISKVTVGTRYIDVVARQITIADSLTLWLEDVRPTNLNGQGAVSWLLDNAEGKKEIQIVSDIDIVATAYYQRMSLYKALHDNDNSFLNRWGGEVQRRGYTIYINKRIGTDRGFTIREGKNLTGFEGTSNIDNLVTRARGQGYNGILGNYIDSSLIGAYNRIYTSVIKYEDVKVKDEYNNEGYDTLAQAQAELDRRIKEEFSKNDIDKIKASYTINFVQLEKTEEYKNYIAAERLFIGDTSRVYIPKLNVDIKVRAMNRKYDILAQKTKEIKLSNYIEAKPLSIKQIVEKLELMDSTETILQLAKDNATNLIKSGLKNSHVIVKENEIIIGDTKDINTMAKVWRWNNGGLGFSSTGYYGEFGTAITNDGAIVADFITVGILNAGLIKAGILRSFNGASWINMEDGTLDLANGGLSFDGINLQIIGKIINVLNGYGVEMDQGGLMFATNGEVVGGIRSSRFTDNVAINGLSIVNTRDGDYTDIGFTESENFEGNTDFYPIIRISKIVHQLLGNFKGIQLLDNIRIKNAKTLYFESNDSKYPHEIYNTAGGLLALFGDNGAMLGYMSGAEKVTAIQIDEKPNQYGSQIFINKQVSLTDKNLTSVNEIYKYANTGRYHHDGWCGSIESTAKRISNLNVYYESGWYAYSSGSQGAPSSYGVVLHLKWGETDFVQIAFDFANTMYQRAWVNGAWTNWTQR